MSDLSRMKELDAEERVAREDGAVHVAYTDVRPWRDNERLITRFQVLRAPSGELEARQLWRCREWGDGFPYWFCSPEAALDAKGAP